jgi:hypothetical protein
LKKKHAKFAISYTDSKANLLKAEFVIILPNPTLVSRPLHLNEIAQDITNTNLVSDTVFSNQAKIYISFLLA